MATVGSQLLTPEAGWRRYDDIDSRFIYSAGWLHSNSAIYYATTYAYTNVLNATVTFKFNGTKLRIITSKASNGSNSITISIDGTSYNYDQVGATDQVLVFEQLGLSNGIHSVVITNNTSNYISLDAIDIDSTGSLIHSILNQNTDILKANIGDAIPCRYTANSNSVGIFSELGTCTANDIPTSGTTIPDGLFYWIFAGYDSLGRMKYIADRNIQNTISWDTINNKGLIGEKTLINMNLATDLTQLATPTFTGTTLMSEGDIIFRRYNSYEYINYNKPIAPIGNKTIIFKMRTTVTNAQVLMCTADHDATKTGFEILYTAAGKIYFRMFYGDGDWAQTCSSVKAVNDWNWHTVAITYDTSRQVKIYIDDMTTPDATATFTKTEPASYQKNLCIGTIVTTDPNIKNYAGDMTIPIINGVVADLTKESIDKTAVTNARLLSGGTVSTDIDNEWNKIIINSTLNGLITAGDNNVWHWSGISSNTSTTISGTDANRVIRGSSTVSGYSSSPSSTTNATIGYRPILLVEIPSILKLLILDGSVFKKISNGDLISVANTTDSQATQEAAFMTNGMNNLDLWTSSLVNKLSGTTFKVAVYKNK